MKELFFNARHMSLTLYCCLQYSVLLPPALRSNVDYMYALRDTNVENRKKLYMAYFGHLPNLKSFEHIFHSCTQNYDCLVCDNTNSAMAELTNTLFWYRAQAELPAFKLCDPWVWSLDTQYGVPVAEQEDYAAPPPAQQDQVIESVRKVD